MPDVPEDPDVPDVLDVPDNPDNPEPPELLGLSGPSGSSGPSGLSGPSGFLLYITLRIMKLTGTAEPMAMMAAYSLPMPAHRKRARNACWQT